MAERAMTGNGADLYRLFWRWHFFAALLVIPFVLWQSVTGTLYLWSEWWIDSRYPGLRFVSPDGERVPLSTQIANALKTAGEGRVVSILVPADPARSTTVIVTGSEGLPYPIFTNPYSGQTLGHVPARAWLPGWSRAFHAGWPLGKAGGLLLELGNCWAIIMLATGLYLWWPRHRPLWRALVPRFGLGMRTAIRDLHSCVAVWFSAVLLFFLISALPWTTFWGGTILPAIQHILTQTNPAGFSPGGASTEKIAQALPAIDQAIAQARRRNIQGDLEVRLAPWPQAPLWLRNQRTPFGTDRYLLADAGDGHVRGDYAGTDLPLIPRFVAFGIHVHQGDFGPVNRWINTSLAAALVWLVVTGIISWWRRKPARGLGAPPAVMMRWPRPLLGAVAALCFILPLLGASVAVLAFCGWITSLVARPA